MAGFHAQMIDERQMRHRRQRVNARELTSEHD
jgi:hypothetical protein